MTPTTEDRAVMTNQKVESMVTPEMIEAAGSALQRFGSDPMDDELIAAYLAMKELDPEIERLRHDCNFLLACIDQCDAAEAPPCELDALDLAILGDIRRDLSQDPIPSTGWWSAMTLEDEVEAVARNAAAQLLERDRRDIRNEIINAPETADFMAGVPIEAAHQRERWGSEHDEGKTPFDWFWLVGYLAQKAAAAAVAGDTEKAMHHTISTAGALANWHAQLSGKSAGMRPGIAPPDEEWTCAPCEAVNLGIRRKCRFCKKPREQVSAPPHSISSEQQGR